MEANFEQRQGSDPKKIRLYWSAMDIGIPVKDLAKKLDMTPAAVSYAVHQGEKIAKKWGYQVKGLKSRLLTKTLGQPLNKDKTDV